MSKILEWRHPRMLAKAAANAVCLCFLLPASGHAADVGPYTPPDPKSQSSAGHVLVIQNASSTSITHIYVSPQNESAWGDDQLGDRPEDTLGPGDSVTLTGITGEIYDVELVTGNGDLCVKRDVKFEDDVGWSVDAQFLNQCVLR